jgi:hypothetical protein
MWLALIMRDYLKPGLKIGMEICAESKLLQEIGLLRVFMGVRGGRIVRDAKYPKGLEIARLINELRLYVDGGLQSLFDGLEVIFDRSFSQKLYLC